MNITLNLNRIILAKSDIRDEIIAKGINVPESERIETYPDYIRLIAGEGGKDTSDATATEEDIVSGKTAYVSTGKITGSLLTLNYYEGENFPTDALGEINDIYLMHGLRPITNKDLDEPTSYTVKWVDWNGNTLKEEILDVGESSTCPSNPSHLYLTFTGWSEGDTVVVTDHNIYNIATYEVTDPDLAILQEETTYPDLDVKFALTRTVRSTTNTFFVEYDDGTSEYIGADTSSNVYRRSHTFSIPGLHTIIVHKADSGLSMLGSSTSLNYNDTTTGLSYNFKYVMLGNNWTLTSCGCKYSTELLGVILPSNMTELPNNSFAGCKTLEYIHLPNTVTIIRGAAFSTCDSLVYVSNLGGNIIQMDNDIFNYCLHLDLVIDLPNLELLGNSTSPGAGVFNFCSKLRKVKSLGKITYILAYCFWCCLHMRSIVLPSTITHIYRDAFANCVALDYMPLPKSITSIGVEAFNLCYSYKEVINLPNLELLGASLTSNDGSIFTRCVNITEIDSLGKITFIGNNNFEECRRLKKINLPNTLTKICARAFYLCTTLEDIGQFPEGITSIGANAFGYCNNLKQDLYLPNLETLGDNSFYSCRRISRIRNLGNVTTIPSSCFYLLSTCTSIILPDSVTSIGNLAFRGCRLLHDIYLPNLLQSIGSYAFLTCTNLREVIIPSTVTTIGGGCFIEAAALRYIYLPNSIISMGSSFVTGARHLVQLEILPGFELNVNLSLNASPYLRKADIIQMFNNLAQRTDTSTTVAIYIGSTIKNLLTADELAIASGKGYTIGA